MTSCTEEKAFEYEDIRFRVEFRLMNNRYICHTVYRNGRQVFYRYLNYTELKFYRECRIIYKDYLQKKGYDLYE